MFMTAEHASEQWGLKEQCVLVPTDLKKVQTSLSRARSDDDSDRGYADKPVIRPGLVNRALELNKLVDVNPL